MGSGDHQRECGTCTLCCKAVGVLALAKATGQQCKHVTDSGCSIYRDRPGECQSFSCLWLKGAFNEEDRPDKLGVVFYSDVSDDPLEALVTCGEPEPGASQMNPRILDLIDAIVNPSTSVIIRNSEYVRKLLHDGTSVQYKIDRSDPLLVQIDLSE